MTREELLLDIASYSLSWAADEAAQGDECEAMASINAGASLLGYNRSLPLPQTMPGAGSAGPQPGLEAAALLRVMGDPSAPVPYPYHLEAGR